jgi:hypothetical protein
LQNAFEAEGKTEWLEVLRPFVAGGELTLPNQEEAAAKLGGFHNREIDVIFWAIPSKMSKLQVP